MSWFGISSAEAVRAKRTRATGKKRRGMAYTFCVRCQFDRNAIYKCPRKEPTMSTPASFRRDCLLTGFSYLGLAITGAFGFLLVRPELFVQGDAARTVA